MSAEDWSEEDVDRAVDWAADFLASATREKFERAIERYGLKALMLVLSMTQDKVDNGEAWSPCPENYVFATLENLYREDKLSQLPFDRCRGKPVTPSRKTG